MKFEGEKIVNQLWLVARGVIACVIIMVSGIILAGLINEFVLEPFFDAAPDYNLRAL